MPTLRTNGIETYYEEYGSGPPVVLLHGAFSDHRVWAERAQSLADDYHIVIPDLRGHGRTGSSNRDAYTIDTYAADLHGLVSALELDRPVVCGLSMGGMVAQQYAATCPNDLSGLVTIGAISADSLSLDEWVERRLALPAARALGRLVGHDRVAPFVGWVTSRGADDFDPGDLEEKTRIETVHAAEYPGVDTGEAEKIRGALLRWGTLDTDYAGISVPALVMYGENETARMAAHAHHLGETIPDTTLRGIPDAGHNSHVDNPEFVLSELRKFLARIDEET